MRRLSQNNDWASTTYCVGKASGSEPVGGADEAVGDPRLGIEMAAVGHDLKVDFGPRLLQFPRRRRRGAAVVAALDDDPGDALQPGRALEQLAGLQPAADVHLRVLY